MILNENDIAVFKDSELSTFRFHKPTGVYFKMVYRDNLSSYQKVSDKFTMVSESRVYKVNNYDDFLNYDGRIYNLMYFTDTLTNNNYIEQLAQIENTLTDDGWQFIAVKDFEGYPIGKTVAYYVYVKGEQYSLNKKQFLNFEIAQLNTKGEAVDKKTFDGKNQKSFFEAVDYFEELISKRQPQPKQEDPSVGVFVYLRNLGGSGQPDSFAEVFGNKVVITYKDLDKVFTPPVKKPYGKLDMYAVEDPKYDVIKGKFALDFDDKLTDAIGEKMGRTSKEEIFVYKMTPYETSEGGEQSSAPEGVNEDSLSLDDIEGEEPENMTGEGQEGQEGQEGG